MLNSFTFLFMIETGLISTQKSQAKLLFTKAEKRTNELKKIDNFYGLMGEKAVKDKLREMSILFNYNEREPNFFEKFREPFDFAISTKDGKYLTLEIKTTKEYPNHKNLIIPEGEWEKSDYTIAVKMLKFERVEEMEIIGYGAFMGYMNKEEIERLPLIPAGEYPCSYFAGRAIELIRTHPISELWNVIDSEAIKWQLNR